MLTLLLSASDIQLPETVLNMRLWRQSEFGVAPGPGACCRAGHGSRGHGILRLLQLLLELLAHTGLQRRGGEPLLREAALQEGDAGAEVGKPIDPARNLLPTENLEEEKCSVRGEVRVISHCHGVGGGAGREADVQKSQCTLAPADVTSGLCYGAVPSLVARGPYHQLHPFLSEEPCQVSSF